MSKKSQSRKIANEKRRLQRIARHDVGGGSSLVEVCAKVALKYRRQAPTNKRQGYELLRAVYAGKVAPPLSRKLTPKQSRAYQESAPCWVRPTSQVDVNSDGFLSSYEWRRVRMVALKKLGARCQCCGATAKDGVQIHVDHIKPRRKYPELALDVTNLQVLCEVCNHGKGNWDETDWRETA